MTQLRTRKYLHIRWAYVAFLLAWSAVIAPIQAENLNIAVAYAPTNLHPAQTTDAAGARILRLVAPALIDFDDNFQQVGKLASQCQLENNAMQVKCLIKPNQKFHDGTPVTPQKIADWFRYLQDPITASPHAGLLQDVDKIVTSKNSIILYLKKRNLLFLNNLSDIPVAYIDHKKTWYGAGEWQLISHKNDGTVVLKSGTKTLTFLHVKDPTARLLKLRKGEVDILQGDIPIELVNYAQKQGFKAQTIPSASYTYIGLNMQSGLTANPAFRQALAHAINRPLIRKTLLAGQAEPALSLLGPEHPSVFEMPEEDYSIEKAKEILKKAALEAPLNLTLSITNNPFSVRLAQVLQQQLQQVGINLTIRAAEWGTFYGNIKQGNVEAYLLTWVGQFDVDFYKYIFHSNNLPPNGLNRGRLQDTEVDNLINQLENAKNKREINVLAKRIQQKQAELLPYIPLYRRHHVLLTRPEITGCKLTKSGGYKGLLACYKP